MRAPILACGCILAGLTCLGAGTFAIATDGRPSAEIVIGGKPVKTARFAAAELQHVIELVTGAKLPVVARPSRNGGAIFVGCGTDETFAGEEYAVRFRDGNFYLRGHDAEEFGSVDYAREETFPDLNYTYHSTLYAVYDFLESYCGVRFYDFGDDGIAFRAKPTLKVVPSADFRREPKMDALRRLYFDKPADASRRDQVLLRFRWRQNVLFGEVNHSVMGIWYRYYKRSVRHPQADCFIESRPEYFAAGYKGKNAPSSIRALDYPGDPDVPPQLCTSAEGPVDYFADEAIRLSRGETVPCTMAAYARPVKGQPYYYPVQEDDSGSWCLCDRCKNDSRLKSYLFRHFDWTSRIARRIAERDPAVGVSTLAYSGTMQYPEGVDLAPNLSVQLCVAPQSWFHPNVYAWQHGAYRDWVSHEAARRPVTLWLYLLNPWAEAQNPHCYDKFFPVVYPHHMGAYAKEFVRDGIRGVFVETAPQYHMLELYLLTKVADRDETDPEAAIAEHFDLFYGAAGKAMRLFCDTLEAESYDIRNYSENVRKMAPKNSYVYSLHPEKDNWFLGSRERVDRLDRLFRAAESAAVTPQEKRRVARYRTRIWDSAVQGRKEFEQREKARAVPLPLAVSARGDYARARKVELVRTAFDRPANASARVSLANDDDNLYVEYAETGGEADAHRGLDVLRNGFECLLSTEHERNLLQVRVSPAGGVQAGISELKYGGGRSLEPVGIAAAENKADGKGWRIRFAVPIRLIPAAAAHRDRLCGNFIRRRKWKGAEFLAWSPTFADEADSALYRFGRIVLSSATRYGRVEVLPDAWTQADITHGLKPGEEFSFSDGVLRMRNGEGKAPLFAFQQKPILPIQPGERVVFDFDARGQMGDWKPACAAFQLTDRSYSAGFAQGEFEVSSEWRHCRVAVVASEGSGSHATTMFRPGFGVFNGGSLEVKNLKIAVTGIKREGKGK